MKTYGKRLKADIDILFSMYSLPFLKKKILTSWFYYDA